KKGRRSAGVQRQYTGTAGKITNCQIGVFCSYANPDRQRVLIDRELYLPESWFADPGRLVDAGVPEHTRFATKPELAWKMIERAADDPLLVFGWVTGDEAYGDNTALRQRCAGRGVNYVFAVSCDHPLVLGGARTRADAAFADLGQAAWQRVSCGDGAKGRRWYDWAWIGLDEHEGQHQWMLARRSISDPTDLAFYRCAANRPVGLPELVRVAGSRWSVEECFQATKNEVGLDHYQVRKHTAWYRHITLAMVAHAHLAFLAAGPPPDPGTDTDDGEAADLATQGARPPGTIAFQQRGRRRTRHAGPAHRRRDPPPPRPPSPAPTPTPTPNPLVTLATPPPSPRPPQPLPTTTTPHRSLNAAGVLDHGGEVNPTSRTFLRGSVGNFQQPAQEGAALRFGQLPVQHYEHIDVAVRPQPIKHSRPMLIDPDDAEPTTSRVNCTTSRVNCSSDRKSTRLN